MNDDEIKEDGATQIGIESTEQGPDKTQPKASKTKTKMQSTHALPSSPPEVLSKILKAYVIASKQGADSVKYSDVAAVSGLHPTVVSRNNAFLSESGFILSERYGYYKPSPETTEFAKQAPWDEEGAKQFIRKQIDRTWYGETIQQQFQMYKALSKSQQIKALGIKSTPDESDASKLDLLFEFLLYFEYIVPDDEGNYIVRHDEISETGGAMHSVDDMISALVKGESPKAVVDRIIDQVPEKIGASVFIPHINLNISITPSTTDEELASVVRKARYILDSLRHGDS